MFTKISKWVNSRKYIKSQCELTIKIKWTIFTTTSSRKCSLRSSITKRAQRFIVSCSKRSRRIPSLFSRLSTSSPRRIYNWLFSIRPDSSGGEFEMLFHGGPWRRGASRATSKRLALLARSRPAARLARAMKLEAFATCSLAPVTRARFVIRQMRKGWDAKAEPITGE